ncbi:thiamine diphosphokinase [Microbacteriaceae bacterium 4G12]
MIIHILAGGPTEHHPNWCEYEEEGVIWAAVDRGAYHLLQAGIVPEVAFGDYDSVTAEELKWMQGQTNELHMMPREKDETDLEIAINWAIQQKPQLIRIFGATGGRLDHALANVQMLTKGLHSGIHMIVVDNKNEIYLRLPGSYCINKHAKFPYISFLPLTDTVTGITLQGFKYKLTDRTIQWGSTLCISNELSMEKGTFSFTSGILMVIRSTD